MGRGVLLQRDVGLIESAVLCGEGGTFTARCRAVDRISSLVWGGGGGTFTA